jgi:Flp pilus assembly protein TadB
MDWLARLESPQNALAVLTAMITPAVLISACGALIFSTSSRLGRVVDRVRALRSSRRSPTPEADDMAADRRQLVFQQLDRQTSRSRLIQRAMVSFYTALGIFVATSVAIAVIAAVALSLTWVAVVLGVVGALFMFYGSVLLVIESRMAMGAIASEMDFVWKVSKRYAAGELDEARGGPATWLGKKIG